MVTGVTSGYSKTLDIVGVGYKAESKDSNLFWILVIRIPYTLCHQRKLK